MSVVHRYKTTSIGRNYANAAGWSNKDYDKWTDEESLISDISKRASLWKRIQKKLMDELPAFPLFEMPNMQLVRSGFENVIMDPLGYNGILEHAYISSK